MSTDYLLKSNPDALQNVLSSDSEDFLAIVARQLFPFLQIIPFVEGDGEPHVLYSERLYDYISNQAKLAEIQLDSWGAKENRAWFFLRELVALIRCISTVAYELRYLELRAASFGLVQSEMARFLDVTNRIRNTFDKLIQQAFLQCKVEVRTLDIPLPGTGIHLDDFPYFQSPGRLQADMQDEEVLNKDSAIVKIATSYLEITEEYSFLQCNRIFSPQELVELVPERVNEERMRTFKSAVHNLQAVYDTHLLNTKMEADDRRLLKLRGFISMALHLLEIATLLVHFHERHERHSRHASIYTRLQKILGTYQMLDVMGNYALFYCTMFLQKGKQLSEEAVMDYAQVTSKRIPIPIYRGFHVRPSTYIAKIVRHYGANVQMHLGNETYDAGCVFDLFRANEEINMEKRRVIAKKLLSIQSIAAIPKENLQPVLKHTLHELMEARLCVVHQEIVAEDFLIKGIDKEELTAEDVRGAMNQFIARLLAEGKIDILMSVLVTFIGDRRPLHDIEILAHSGYGEDAQGKNVPLPRELSYLYK